LKFAESLSVVAPQEPRSILATGSYLGEGFDDARLDTLLLTMPISWRGTLQQYVGLLHRLHENKKQVLVYDYADVLTPMLARVYKKRLAGYSALGYVVSSSPPAWIWKFGVCPGLRIRSCRSLSSEFASFGEDHMCDGTQRNAETIAGVAALAFAQQCAFSY
jgi:hypothetical protein